MAKLRFRKWFDADAENYLDLIRKARKPQDDGRIGITINGGLSHEELITGLHLSLELEEANEEILRTALRQVLFSAELPLDFSANALLAAISANYWRTKNDKSKEFVVLYAMYLTSLPSKRDFEFEDARIELHAEQSEFLSTAIAAQSAERDDLPSRIRHQPFPSHWATVWVRAGSAENAFHVANQRFEELRGLMNFVFNKTKLPSWTFGNIDPSPINDVRRGKYMSVHSVDGSLVDGALWFDRDWHEPKKLVGFANEEAREKNLLHYFAQIEQKGELSQVSRKALRLYCGALDSANWKSSFLELWIVLERLLLSKSEPHSKISDRLSSLYSDSWMARVVANQLVTYRNRNAHDEYSAREQQQKTNLEQLNRFVCDALRLVMLNKWGFQSMSDVRAFLDAPLDRTLVERDIAEHQRQIVILERALKFREPNTVSDSGETR